MPEQCVHHWMLDSNTGEVVPGKCQKCGKRRLFSAFVSYGEQTMQRLNTARANEAKQMKYGIHLPNSKPPKDNEIVW